MPSKRESKREDTTHTHMLLQIFGGTTAKLADGTAKFVWESLLLSTSIDCFGWIVLIGCLLV